MNHETALRGTLAALKMLLPIIELTCTETGVDEAKAAITNAEAALAVTADEWLAKAFQLVGSYGAAHRQDVKLASSETCDACAAISKDLFAHLRSHPAAPEGYALVPIEPTDAMCEAAWESEGTDYVGEHLRIWQIAPAYRAMIAAAGKE